MRRIELHSYDTKEFARKYGPWAVIAGASEGTGASYAEQLASMGVNLALASRRSEALEELGARLAKTHGISFRSIVVDLMKDGAGAQLVQETADLDVGLYVSNAGADGAGNSFLDSPVERSQNLLRMNAVTLVDATHGFGQRFKRRGGGGIVIMSSGAGLGGQPWLGMYSATKAFEVNFAESLWAELQPDNIDVIGVCAPTMDTPTLRRATAGTSFDIANAYSPDDVVHATLANLGKEPLLIVPDGPEEAKIPQIQADRKQRLIMLAEWAKAYTAGAKG